MERQGYDLLCDAKELVCIDMYVFAMERNSYVELRAGCKGKVKIEL